MIDLIPDPDPRLVGIRLEALREALGISERKSFAAMIGVDPSSYTKIAEGNKPLKAEMGYRAARRFGVSMDFLYDGDVSRLPSNLRDKIITYLGGQKA